MPFSTREVSRTLGEPVNLFLFVGAGYGESYFDGLTGEVVGPFAYTDAEQAVTMDDPTYGVVVYQPIAISRGSITTSGSLDKSSLEIRMEDGLPLGNLFLAYPPSTVINAFIREGHQGDSTADVDNYPVVFAGRILSANHPPNETVFSCEPISTSLKRPGLRRNYQISCPHVLYGPDCRANRTAATVGGTVTSLSANLVTLTDGWNAEPVIKYHGGLVTWTHSETGALMLRSIRSVTGNTVTLSAPCDGLEVGDTLRLSLGCNRLLGGATGDCVNLHNNAHNYGGMVFIPNVNPLSSGRNNFY